MRQDVAVKILRPGIKQRFRADLEAYYAGAALAERWAPSLRRLRPTDVVKTLDRSARLELDLRLEAASISEMAENIKDDEGFVIPDGELGPHGRDGADDELGRRASRSAIWRRSMRRGSTARR